MNFTAKDIMQTHVITVGLDDPLMSVHRLFVDEEISGAPVINERGEIAGVITIRDLMRDHHDREDRPRDDNLFYLGDFAEEVRSAPLGEEQFVEALMSRTAADVMSPDAISVDPDMPISKVAETLIVNRIHRVLVLEKAEEGKCLMGIISLFDLVELLT